MEQVELTGVFDKNVQDLDEFRQRRVNTTKRHRTKMGITKMRIWGEYAEYILLPAVLLIAWSMADRGTGRSVIPSLMQILTTFVQKITDGTLILAVATSLGRVLKGYLLAAVTGVLFGILIGLSEHVKRLTDLIIQILRPIPPIAWIPLAIFWFGIGESSKVFLIYLGGFFVILINVIDGIKFKDERMVEVAKVSGLSQLQYITKVVIPGALPSIFTGLRVGLNTCWTCVVAAELVASTSGIGYMISNARNYGQMDVILVGMFTIGFIGKAMDLLLNRIEKRAIYWKN